MSFASNEGSFQATTSDLCFNYFANGVRRSTDLFSSFTENMCKGLNGTITRALHADLGPLNLFALTSGEYAAQVATTRLTCNSDSLHNFPIPTVVWLRGTIEPH